MQADAAASKDDVAPPTPALQVTGLQVWFPRQSGLLRRTVGYVKAVDGIDFTPLAWRNSRWSGNQAAVRFTAGKVLVGLAPVNAGPSSYMVRPTSLACIRALHFSDKTFR